MTHTIALLASASVLTRIADPAARALLLAAGAGVGLAAFRVRATSVRLLTWSAVLYAALAMPLLGWLLPPLSVPTPAFLELRPQSNETEAAAPLAAATAPATRTVPSHTVVTTTSSSDVMRQTSLATPRSAAIPRRAQPVAWGAVATGIYLAVALLLLARFAVGLVFARRLIRSSQPILEPRVVQRLFSRAHACSLAAVPQAAESELISVPVTMGALRSTILLPTGWRDWDDAKLDAVVTHEMSHVARRDALTQRLSLLHRAIFWFSPLAWWLDRHLADLAEQASDEAALSCGADRTDYARTLLGFFEALQAAPGRVWWQGVSMAKSGQAEQRLERILAWRGAVTMGLSKSVLKKSGFKKSLAIVVIAFAIPVIYLAAAVRPASANQSAQAQTPPPPQSVPVVASPAPEAAPPAPADAELGDEAVPAVAPVGPAAPAVGVGNMGALPVRPMVPIAPVSPVARVAPAVPATWAIHANSSHRHRYSYNYDGDDEQRFIIVTGNSDSLTMSGSTEDVRHVEKLRKQIPGDFIWFQSDEKSYIIRDQATIDRARKLWAPEEELGKKQEELGKQQEVLGKQQEALGKKMEEVHVQVPDMTAEMDKLKAELKQLSAGATVEQVGRIQSEIGELQSKIGEIQSHAGDQQSKIGEEMGALGEKQGKLGEQQGELGRQQGELAEKASRDMKILLDEAIKNGKAQPEPGSGGTASL